VDAIRYWCGVLWNATVDAAERAGFKHPKRWLASIIATILATCAFYYFTSDKTAVQDKMFWITCVLSGGGIVFFALFLFSVFSIPPRMHREQKRELDSKEAEIGRLKSKLDQQASEAERVLWEVRSRGIALRDRDLSGKTDQEPDWIAECETWLLDSRTKLQAVLPDIEFQRFEQLERQDEISRTSQRRARSHGAQKWRWRLIEYIDTLLKLFEEHRNRYP